MSVIVAIKENNKVYLGCDSQVTKGGTRTTLKNENNFKIWKVRGVKNCLMGHVGSVRDSNVVRLMDGLVTEYNVYKNHVNYEFVVKIVVPEIIKELKSYGYVKDDSYFDHMESSYFFIFRDKVYVINTDGCVIEVNDYAAIGSGEDQAIGSLISTDGDDPRERIIKAIKASAASDIYVDYPIILTDSESTKFEIINEKNEKDYLSKLKKN